MKEHSVGPGQNILDRIAVKIIEKFYLSKKQTDELFLPTYLYQLLQGINTTMPNSHLIMSDFDSLSSSVSGINAPIVSRKG